MPSMHPMHGLAHTASMEHEGGQELAQHRHAAFQELRPVCSVLLQHRTAPAALHETLEALKTVLERLHPAGLAACWDYVMFPLLLIIDSIAPSRLPATGAGAQAGGGGPAEAPVPAAKADKVSESALGCLLVMLERSQGVEVDQVMELLQRLMPLTQMSTGPEELRALTFKVAGAAFGGLKAPKRRQAEGAVAAGPPNENLLPVSGYMIHTCLQLAQAQLQASGSRDVRLACLQCLSQVVEAIGSPDDLAFFVPGIASGLARQLLPPVNGSWSGSGASAGTGASSACMAAALACLASTIESALGDARAVEQLRQLAENSNHSAAAMETSTAGASSPTAATAATSSPSDSTPSSSSSALSQLQKLSAALSAGKPLPTLAPAGPAPPPAPPPPERPAPGQRPNLRVERTAGWLKESGARISGLLAQVLPALCSHPRPSIREAAAHAAVRMLRSCSEALGREGTKVLLEVVLTLAQDEWQQVSRPCVGLIRSSCGSGESSGSEVEAVSNAAPARVLSPPPAASSTSSSSLQATTATAGLPSATGGTAAGPAPSSSAGASAALHGLLEELVDGLLPAVRRGEAAAIAAARRLESAMLMAGAHEACRLLVQRPAMLSQLLASLCQSLAFDPARALLLLHSRQWEGGSAQLLPSTDPPPLHKHPNDKEESRSGAAKADTEGATAGSKTGGGGGGGAAGAGPGKAGGLMSMPAPSLPRMPQGLLHVASLRCYEALASVARCLGHLARASSKPSPSSAPSSSSSSSAPATGGSDLRRVMDALFAKLHAESASNLSSDEADDSFPSTSSAATTASSSSALSVGSGSAGREPGAGWQLASASVVVLASEVMFGASDGWQPAFSSESPSSSTPSPSSTSTSSSSAPAPSSSSSSSGPASSSKPAPDLAYEGLAQQLLQELVKPRLWGLTTHQDASPPSSHPPSTKQQDQHQQRISAQDLARNALLSCCLLDSAGTLARCLGPRLVSAGRPLRTILVPLLERLADPCPTVRAAAQGAVASLCVHCGYGWSLHAGGARGQGVGLSALVASNADYVVDAMCRQLRDLGRHPRAPQLLAALLDQAGVAPQLLTLLAEPLRAALKGLSILSRLQRPHYAHCFLLVLLNVAEGARAQAASVLRETDAAVKSIRAQAAEAQGKREAELAGAPSGAPSSSSGAGRAEAGPAGAAEATEADGEEARAYFMEALARKQEAAGLSGVDLEAPPSSAAPGAGPVSGGAGTSGGDGWFVMSGVERQEAEERTRKVHAAAVMAAAAVDAAGPLTASDVLREAILALDACQSALQGLGACTRSLDLDLQLIEEAGSKLENAIRPVRPETPKLLPAVASFWPLLLACLRGRRTAVVERALALLSELVALAGGAFLGGRLRQQALPLLMQLLRHGTAHVRATRSLTGAAIGLGPSASGRAGGAGSGGGGASGEDGDSEQLAPAAVQRVRVAVLECLAAVGVHGRDSKAVQQLAWELGSAALPYLGQSHSAALRTAAAAAVRAAAGLDADAVWMMLYDTAASGGHGGGGAAAARSVQAALVGGPAGPLPAWRGCSRASHGAGSGGGGGSQLPAWPVTASLGDDCASAAALLLPALEDPGAPAPVWHALAPVVMPDWTPAVAR